MLRRSLTILSLLVLFGLGMILAYAAWNRSATPEALARAQSMLDAGQAREAALLLTHAERSLGPTGADDVRNEIYDLRYQAHEELGNFRQALRDLDNLDGKAASDDKRLRLERAKVRLLYKIGQRDSEATKLLQANRVASELLARNPDDQRLHEYAGQILQGLYRRDLEKLVQREIPSALPERITGEAIQRLMRFLYRPETNPTAMRDFAELELMLESHVLDEKARSKLLERIRSARDRIQDSVEHYRKAVRGPQRAFSALKGYTGQLLRADRAFEAALLSTRYLRRFLDDEQSIVACARAIEAWLRLGNAKAAGDAARLWLATHDLAALAKEYDLDASWVDSYVWIANALHADRDGKSLDAFTTRLWKINEKSRSKLWARAYGHLIYGWRHDTSEAPGARRREYKSFGEKHWPRAKPRDGRDLLLENWHTRLEIAKRHKDSDETATVLDEWILARPKDPEPRLMRARRFIRAGRGRMALGDLGSITPSDAGPAEKDAALELMLEARDHEYAANGQDSKSLLAQLVAAPGATIVIPDPVMHYGIAKLAAEVASRGDRIAPEMARLVQRHSREAAEAFPWSNSVRGLASPLCTSRGRALPPRAGPRATARSSRSSPPRDRDSSQARAR